MVYDGYEKLNNIFFNSESSWKTYSQKEILSKPDFDIKGTGDDTVYSVPKKDLELKFPLMAAYKTFWNLN